MTKQEADTTKIAIINNNISYIQKDIAEIKGSVKELAGVYVTREQLVEVAKATEERLLKLEESSHLWKWLSPSLAAVLSSVMTFLIIQYLNNLK